MKLEQYLPIHINYEQNAENRDLQLPEVAYNKWIPTNNQGKYYYMQTGARIVNLN